MTVVEIKDTTRTTAHSASCTDVCIASDLDNRKDMVQQQKRGGGGGGGGGGR